MSHERASLPSRCVCEHEYKLCLKCSAHKERAQTHIESTHETENAYLTRIVFDQHNSSHDERSSELYIGSLAPSLG